jgi:hypothetical protein
LRLRQQANQPAAEAADRSPPRLSSGRIFKCDEVEGGERLRMGN